MTRRQPYNISKTALPRIWLMTDERFGSELLPAIRRLPTRSGIVFRHYHLGPKARRDLFKQVRKVCAQRGHMLILAGPERLALRWHADGFHGGSGVARLAMLRSAPVHDHAELRGALRNKADLLFISPLFETASHAGGKVLGRLAFNTLAHQRGPALVIALGGMIRQRADSLKRQHIHGWAAIDAFRKKKF
jgi:thiamine-phosphate pyrophosphorylase